MVKLTLLEFLGGTFFFLATQVEHIFGSVFNNKIKVSIIAYYNFEGRYIKVIYVHKQICILPFLIQLNIFEEWFAISTYV